MRMAIMGAGGVGGYFGARLAAAGEDVVFIARGAHLEALKRDGLTLHSENGDCRVDPAEATDDTAEVGAVDAILFCVKTYDTEVAARACLPLLGPETFVLTLQNGVESVALISGIVGQGRVLGGATYIVSNIEAPGVIRHIGPSALIEVGEPEGPGPRARALVDALGNAGVEALLADDMEATLWRKFVLLGATSALTALTRQTLGVVRSDPVMRDVFKAAVRETAAVAGARGISLPDDLEDQILDTLDTVIAADAKASQLVDLERGKPLELEWLSGAIHRFGEESGVATPVHSAVYAALKPFAGGKAPITGGNEAGG